MLQAAECMNGMHILAGWLLFADRDLCHIGQVFVSISFFQAIQIADFPFGPRC